MARQDFAEHYARQAFKELLGRDPSPAELAQVVPIFMGTDPNIHDVAGGRAVVAQIAQAEQNAPEKVYARQQAQYQADAPAVAVAERDVMGGIVDTGPDSDLHVMPSSFGS